MLSMSPIRSAAGSAEYFTKDDYYTSEESAETSAWGGEGAEILGLAGEVDKETFEKLLNGELPNGEMVGQVENRQPGMDLTFSMPKSASIMAYIGGDRRILAANMAAVRETMRWVEKNLAEGRKDIDNRKVPIRSGNLVYSLFAHDTSRALDPQGHIHAVVKNLTRMPDGEWQALHNGAIWRHNTVIGAIYHAHLRERLEQLGYRIESAGKHGMFEIAGISRAVIDAFSQRRTTILEKAAELGIRTPEGRNAVTINTRDPKLNVVDRESLRAEWKEKASELGFTGSELLAEAKARSTDRSATGILGRGYEAVSSAISGAWAKVGEFLRPADPLVDRGLARLVQSPGTARAQFAVASAIRILSQREAAFDRHQLSKTALDLGLRGVVVDSVEHRIDQLVERGALVQGVPRHDGTIKELTTAEALATETKILTEMEQGKGKGIAILSAAEAPDRLRAVAKEPLNAGQIAAGVLALSSEDRMVTIQGLAGAGKSTMLHAVARVAEAEGRTVIGLAFQNKMVRDLANDAGIEARTIASFLIEHGRHLRQPSGTYFEEARDAMRGKVLVVDEGSMVSNDQMLRLHQIANLLEVEKLVVVGDRKQLLSIDAGKAFALIQAAGATMARMVQNLRQRTPELRAVAALANMGRPRKAMEVLGGKVIEDKEHVARAADMWLALSPEERERTAVFASGRDTRAELNRLIQDGLAAEGSIGGPSLKLTVFDRVNLTREELRYTHNYRPGQTLEAMLSVRAIGLDRGLYTVTRVLASGKVEVTDGKHRHRFDPKQIPPDLKEDRLGLAIRKEIQIQAGDRIRWTATDKKRGMDNSALARVLAVNGNDVVVETAGKQQVTLPAGDPMLGRIDLAYSLNMHMAQGISVDNAIAVMSSYERNLSNQRLFNVIVTRVRYELHLVVDDVEKLARALERNTGDKTSSLETTGRVNFRISGLTGGGTGGPMSPAPTAPALPPELDKPPDGGEWPAAEPPPPIVAKPAVSDAESLKAPSPPAGKEAPAPVLPLPERSIGLDL
ncbi:MobF family relaxase [Sphingomonas sp. H39-1-10]|uniref:MobF family relaxase n=1 Tax=Sphingomonas pollutisoli TaxID=3030829 RepID=UPI0023B8883A|nr:MobF family relaxase [Sphingomonas pollutisoli]MDF0490446.1 MobF family relaxase [Sphingomonas pollutisoli]